MVIQAVHAGHVLNYHGPSGCYAVFRQDNPSVSAGIYRSSCRYTEVYAVMGIPLCIAVRIFVQTLIPEPCCASLSGNGNGIRTGKKRCV